MSTRYDILEAKREFGDHLAEHKCTDADSAKRRGQIPCAKRIELWHAWMGVAALWGLEPDDADRARRQYEAQLRPAAA